MKDSKNSYEQKSWEYYAASHARAVAMLEKYGHIPYAKEVSTRQIERAEEVFPCLRNSRSPST